MKYYNKLQRTFLFFLYFILLLIKNTKANTTNEIVAIINEDIILESDIKNTQIFNEKDNENYFYKKNNDELPQKKKILDQLITDTLILQLAKRANIHLNNEQTNNIINYIAEENHMTMKEFKSYLLKKNISYNTYVNHVRNDTIINTISDYEMHQRIKISPHELNTLTKKLILKNNNVAFQLDHILIPLQENTTNYQIQKAHSLGIFLAKEMKYGIDVNKLIKLYSNKKTFPTIQINKIHWKTIQELPTLFSESLIKNKIYINKIIGPIYSNIGFHILKINDIDNSVKENISTKVHIRHIFIKTSNVNNNQKIQKKLLKIIESIKNGYTTFSIEAKQISEDPNSSNNGGDLGWKYLENFDKTFQTPIKALKKGEITNPIKSDHGWHIIQLLDIKKIDKNEIFYQNNAYKIIFNEKLHETMNHWIEELKILTFIKILKNDN